MITNYLANRNQYVNIDGCSSGQDGIKCEVPQGSILGPKLVILYINDMCMYQNLSNLLCLQMTQISSVQPLM